MNKTRKDIPEYGIWKNMRARCSNGCKSALKYKEKNITVCKEWNDFLVFYSDMGKRPSTKHSIDRIDNDGNYEPSNCRWATQKTQCENRGSFNRIFTHNGKTMVLKEWARETGMPYSMLHKRIVYQKMSFKDAISKKSRYKSFQINGRFQSLKEWAEELNISYSAIATWISRNKDKSFIQALENYNIKHQDIV